MKNNECIYKTVYTRPKVSMDRTYILYIIWYIRNFFIYFLNLYIFLDIQLKINNNNNNNNNVILYNYILIII